MEPDLAAGVVSSVTSFRGPTGATSCGAGHWQVPASHPAVVPTAFRLVKAKHQRGCVAFLCFYVPRKMLLLLSNKPQHARGDERGLVGGMIQGKGEMMEKD